MDVQTKLLAFLIVVDIVQGVVFAMINHEFSSNEMKRGLATHTLIFFVLLFVTLNAKDLAVYSTYIDLAKSGFITMYILSIVETYAKNGGSLPDVIKNLFKKDE